MNRLQPLYPIPVLDTSLDFALLARFDERNLAHLKDDYLRLPNNAIIPPLMRLECRNDALNNPLRRQPYRAGVIAGSIILRGRLNSLEVRPVEVFAQDVVNEIDWNRMKIARFALRQYFAEGVDVKRHLYETIELPWAQQNSRFVNPAARRHELREDWMAIGLGDTLRLGEMAYSQQTGLPLREPVIFGIADDTVPAA